MVEVPLSLILIPYKRGLKDSITVRLGVNKYHDPSNEKNENISKESSITACGVVEICDNQCQKSLSLEGAEI